MDFNESYCNRNGFSALYERFSFGNLSLLKARLCVALLVFLFPYFEYRPVKKVSEVACLA